MKINKITPQIAALYLGQKCDVNWITYDSINGFDFQTISFLHIEKIRNYNITIPPHLRRLDSITEDEFTIMDNLAEQYSESYGKLIANGDHTVIPPEHDNIIILGQQHIWLYLLSKGFDLFGLIDAGLAKEVNQ